MGDDNTLLRLEGRPSRALVGSTIGFFTGFTMISVFSPFSKLFADFMNLTPTMIGLLVSIPTLSSAILRIPFSAMTDTTGGRKPFLILLILSMAGLLGLSMVLSIVYPQGLTKETYPILLFLGALCGCGGATFSVGISQISYWFPQRKQGSVLGVYAGLGNMSPGFASILFPLTLSYFGLPGVYFVWLFFLMFGTVIYYIVGKNAWYFQLLKKGISNQEARRISSEYYGQSVFPKGKFSDSLLSSAKSWKTWGLVLTYFTTFGGMVAMGVWLPTYWQMFHSSTLETAIWLTAAFVILAALFRVIGGRISDAFGGGKIAILSLSIMLATAIILTLSPDFNISIIGIVMMAIGMGMANSAVFKLVPQEIPHAVGGAAGWVGGLGALGGFAIVNLLSMFIRTTDNGDLGYARGFIVFVILSLASIGAMAMLKHARRKRNG